ncbi:hypothetical protein EMIHUDRAFT_238613 [Emiliania huxleyi CCMP1516]|uniref:Guanylate cyclase domain-containing protein n=2 Tax=Emiliania huxleyi TaxID=2903 RepID=A0A0D3JLJ0_EMIH1|nr:hypothetical protein EMIHUDRAFT_238613 [Emiliania huxleyi CCMP1516]EOD24375.1 hypothetical protein EMIHUDRAFT_238613 [Emiliania huxleyi CCMP1516]|eukprot:XP_005776804.1 hypothetical protein EMIHUDRAFT_238613 [Emiliania huxleyi CCMP1516]
MSSSSLETRALERLVPRCLVEVYEGALAFIDISGFSRLSELLSERHGAQGAELLQTYINRYFRSLIEAALASPPTALQWIVVAHGGDILKFAGDAFIASWRADSAASAPGQAAGGGATCGSSRGSRAGRGSCAQTFFDGDALAAALRPGSQASGDASEPEPSVLGCWCSSSTASW